MAITDWFTLLNWKQLPNFGFCHTIALPDEFRKNYVETAALTEFRTNLLATLNGTYETMNMRVLGKPGTGKTTFLYSLMRLNGKTAQNDLLGKYFVYVFHVNKARAVDPEPHVIEQFVLAWEKYFTDAGFSHAFDSINSQKIDHKSKLNKCSEFYKEHKNEFEKVFIVALDDVDLLEPQMMRQIVVASISHLEVASVKKWLFIREETFDKYDPDTKRIIAQFFPEPRPFPTVSLHDVIQHRISNTAGDRAAQNPFTVSLCDRVQAAYDDCLRESLPALKSVLENSFQSGFHKNQSIEFIQQYLDKAGIGSLIRSHTLPNLHLSQFRSVPYPIPLDMLSLMVFIQDDKLLFGATNHAINARASRVNSKYKDGEIKLQPNHFSHSLEALIKGGLAVRRGAAVFLTPMGRSVASYCGKKFYSEICFESVLTGSLTSHQFTNDYQLMSMSELDHQDIARIWTTAGN